MTTRRLVDSRRGNNCSSRRERERERERETSSCLLFRTVLSWAELNWTVLNWTELWWEQAPFKYCSSHSTGQLHNWVITYHGTLAPNESQTTISKRLVSLSPFFRANILHDQRNFYFSLYIVVEVALMCKQQMTVLHVALAGYGSEFF